MNVPEGLNCWTSAEDYTREMLSTVAPFQAFVGAENAEDALEKIFIDELPEPEDGSSFTDIELEVSLGAFAVVTSPTGTPYSLRRSKGGYPLSGGTIEIMIHQVITTPEHLENDEVRLAVDSRNFKNSHGLIAEKLWAAIEADRRGWIRSLDVTAGILENHRDEWLNKGHTISGFSQFFWGES